MLEAVGQFETVLQGSGSGYFGEFGGYDFPIELSDRVQGIRHRDIIHQGTGMVRYR